MDPHNPFGPFGPFAYGNGKYDHERKLLHTTLVRIVRDLVESSKANDGNPDDHKYHFAVDDETVHTVVHVAVTQLYGLLDRKWNKDRIKKMRFTTAWALLSIAARRVGVWWPIAENRHVRPTPTVQEALRAATLVDTSDIWPLEHARFHLPPADLLVRDEERLKRAFDICHFLRENDIVTNEGEPVILAVALCLATNSPGNGVTCKNATDVGRITDLKCARYSTRKVEVVMKNGVPQIQWHACMTNEASFRFYIDKALKRAAELEVALPCSPSMTMAMAQRRIEQRTEPGVQTDDICAICLESGEGMRRLFCGHEFHGTCLAQILRGIRNASCPVCRRADAIPEPFTAPPRRRARDHYT